jgi:gamma-glutamyl hydrolase
LGNRSKVTPDVVKTLGTLNVTLNIHHQGIAPETFDKYPKMKAFISVLANNADQKGKVFSSLIEAKDYPFYGTQFHPEFPAFEFVDNPAVVHTEESITANNYFSKFFVSEARQNNHKYPSVKEENAALIYNFSPEYTEEQTRDEQTYFFKIK